MSIGVTILNKDGLSLIVLTASMLENSKGGTDGSGLVCSVQSARQIEADPLPSLSSVSAL